MYILCLYGCVVFINIYEWKGHELIMKKFLSGIMAIAFSLTSFAAVFAENTTGQTLTAEQFAAAVTSGEMGAFGAVSMQYALMDNGEIVSSGHSGVYSKTENRALTSENMYGIGSVSKMYVTAAAMKLCEENKMELDGKVIDYIPEFTMQDERYKDITIRMLMNHSSGLMGTSYTNAFLFNDADSYAHDTILDQLSRQRLKAAPGEYSVYCNDGFTLLEIAVERASGMNFTDYIDKTFLTPMGLNYTKTPQSEFDRSLLAKTYLPTMEDDTPVDTVGFIGTGGIYSNAEDLCKFGSLLSGEMPEILSKESAELMAEHEYKRGIWLNDNRGNAVAYGLGWDSVNLYPFSEYGMKALTKGGDTLLYHAALVTLPEYGISAAVLSSGSNSGLNTMMAEMLIKTRLSEKGVALDAVSDSDNKTYEPQEMPDRFKEYSGLYAGTGATVEINIDNNELVVDQGGIEQRYAYVGDGKFAILDGGTVLVYFDETAGRTYLVLETEMQIPGTSVTSRSFAYNAQKLEKNELSDDVKEAWDNRADNAYFILSEKASSQMTALSAIISNLGVDTENGYASACKITDENTALSVIQIPMSAGRDCFDLKFIEENGREIMLFNDMRYMSSKDIVPIYDGGEAICTILEDGYIRWMSIPESSSGKTLKISSDENMSVFVYDNSGSCLNDTAVTGDTEIVLPENGYIAFAGEKGDVFTVLIQ